MQIILVFVSTLVLVFAAAAIAMRPTKERSAIHRRVEGVVSGQSNMGSANALRAHDLLAVERDTWGWLKPLVSTATVTRALQKLILQSQAQTTVSTMISTSAVLAAAAGALTWMASPMPYLAFAAAPLAASLPLLYLYYKRSKRLAAFNLALPECIETCARSLKVGHSVVASLEIVAEQASEPAKTEFSEVFKKQNYGLPLSEALTQMLDRIPSTDLQVMVTAFLVQRDTGGNLVHVLDRLVVVMRDRVRIQRDIQTHTAQGRLTGWILCALPIVLIIATNLINPGYSKVLFTNDTGKKLLYGGVALLACGAFIISRIVNGIEV
jgi:tight adherence protein B